jgi:hypothetical protein
MLAKITNLGTRLNMEGGIAEENTGHRSRNDRLVRTCKQSLYVPCDSEAVYIIFLIMILENGITKQDSGSFQVILVVSITNDPFSISFDGYMHM